MGGLGLKASHLRFGTQVQREGTIIETVTYMLMQAQSEVIVHNLPGKHGPAQCGTPGLMGTAPGPHTLAASHCVPVRILHRCA